MLGRHIKKMRKQFLTSRSFRFSGTDTCKHGKCYDTDEHPWGTLQTESNPTRLEETPGGRREAVNSLGEAETARLKGTKGI